MPDSDDQDVVCRRNPVTQHIGTRTEDCKPLAHVIAGRFANVRLLEQTVSRLQDHVGGAVTRRVVSSRAVEEMDQLLDIIDRPRPSDQGQGERSPWDSLSSQLRARV